MPYDHTGVEKYCIRAEFSDLQVNDLIQRAGKMRGHEAMLDGLRIHFDLEHFGPGVPLSFFNFDCGVWFVIRFRKAPAGQEARLN